MSRKIVLVVEDEPLIRMFAMDLVEEAGFEAIEAPDADEAIKILESRDDIAIVFTDIDMPGSIDGMKLAAAVQDRWPPIRIIVVSGQVRGQRLVLPDGVPFFAKPYDPAKVADQLHRLAAG